MIRRERCVVKATRAMELIAKGICLSLPVLGLQTDFFGAALRAGGFKAD